MARMLVNPTLGHVLYVVEGSVGRSAENAKDDVMLVQFFLKALMPDVAGEQGYRPPGQLPIQADGMYGSVTQAYIDYYQKQWNVRNTPKVNPSFPRGLAAAFYAFS